MGRKGGMGRNRVGAGFGLPRRIAWATAGLALGTLAPSAMLWPTPTGAQSATPSARRDKPPQAPAAAQKQAGEVSLTATSANVGESGSPVRIQILRWSTEEERSPVVAALTPPAAPAAGPSADLPAGAAAAPPTAP